HPAQARNHQRRSKPRADGAFRDAAGKMGGTHSRHQREPGSDFKLVVDEEGSQRAGSRLAVRAETLADSEELVVMLVEGVDPGLQVVLWQSGAESNLAARVIGRAMVGRSGPGSSPCGARSPGAIGSTRRG